MEDKQQKGKWRTTLTSRKLIVSVVSLIAALGLLEGSGIEGSELAEAIAIVVTALVYIGSVALEDYGLRRDGR